MPKFDFSGITSVFSRKDNKPAETTQQKVESAVSGNSSASPLSGLAAALASQANKTAEEPAKAEEVKQEPAQVTKETPVAPAAPVKEELNSIDSSVKLFKDSRDITIAGACPVLLSTK